MKFGTAKFALMTACSLLVSCSENGFQGASGRRTLQVRNTSPSREGLPATGTLGTPCTGSGCSSTSGGATTGGTTSGGSTTEGTNPNTNVTGGTPTQPTQPIDPCSNASRSYAVLVVDLKSGWFAGDGGDFFKTVVNNVCGNSTVKVSYVHITRGGAVANVDLPTLLDCQSESSGFLFFKTTRMNCTAMKDIRSFDEFWILTGDEHDDADLDLGSPLFGSILSRARELRDTKPNSGFFFGAGLGNIHHANAIANALFPEISGGGQDPEFGLFVPGDSHRGTLPSPDMAKDTDLKPLLPGNGVQGGTFDPNAYPFRAFAGFGALQSLFDYERCVGDAIAPLGNGGNKKVVATDHCGRTTIAQFMVGQHKIMADANVARFYGFPEYFRRSILLLLP